MKIIFIKYNRDRQPCYQTLTKIVDVDNVRKAIKEPLTSLAQDHVKAIYYNYKLLSQKYPHIKLCKPTLQSNSIEFEMANGDSLEKLLKAILDKGDKDRFLSEITNYVNYIDKFVSKRQVQFEACNEFNKVFGTCVFTEPQDIIDVANVDLIFSNLFVFEKEITQIDYEWVFTFNIPKSFIIWRALMMFFVYHGNTNVSLIDFSELLSHVGIDIRYHDMFMQMDERLQKYVCGSEFKYKLNAEYMKPKVGVYVELESMRQKLVAKDKELAAKNQELTGILNSSSWKITKPFRDFKKYLKMFISK